MATAGAIGIAAAAIALTPASASAQTPPPPAPQPAPYPQAPAPYPPQAYPYPPQAYPPQAYPPQAYPPQAYPQPYAPQPYAGPAPVYVMPAPQAAPQGPRKITDWEEGEPIPPGYHKVSHVRVGLIVGGAVTFGLTYLTTALAGAMISDIGSVTSCGNSCASAKPLIVPVAGPFIVLPHTTGTTATGSFFLVVDGVLQIGGLAMLIAGIAAPKVDLVRDETGTIKVEPTPIAFDRGAGFGFRGTF